MGSRLNRLYTVAVGAAITLGGSLLAAPYQTRANLSPIKPADGRIVPAADRRDAPGVKRSRVVTVDFEGMRRPGDRQMLREPGITLELFPDVTILATFERYDDVPSGVVWVGRIDGVPLSTVTLAYDESRLTGTVVMPGATYHIRPAEVASDAPLSSAPLHLVTDVDQAALPREAPPVEVRFSPQQLAAAADRPMEDSADQIDVMVLYTPLAAANAGGQAGIANLINLGISEANTSYAESGVAQRIRLVHSTQVAYAESGNFSTVLNDLRGGFGAFSGVPALRDTYGADLVALLIHPSNPSACGVAFLMTQVSQAFAPNAYSVTDTSCVPGFTLAHELGHNMGARHDWYIDNGITPYTYAHGYVNALAGQRWRTIMAYPDQCTAMGFNCTRILRWANADQRYVAGCDSTRVNCAGLQYWYFPGMPMGVAGGTNTACPTGNTSNTNCDADDRRALNNTALTVANFRQRVVADR